MEKNVNSKVPFVKVNARLVDDNRRDTYDLAVYTALARLALANGSMLRCSPTAEALGTLAKCSRARLFKSLRNLCGWGYITVEKRTVRGAQIENTYWLCECVGAERKGGLSLPAGSASEPGTGTGTADERVASLRGKPVHVRAVNTELKERESENLPPPSPPAGKRHGESADNGPEAGGATAQRQVQTHRAGGGPTAGEAVGGDSAEARGPAAQASDAVGRVAGEEAVKAPLAELIDSVQSRFRHFDRQRTAAAVKEWCCCYGNETVSSEVPLALQWLSENRRGYRNPVRFLGNWLRRCHRRGPDGVTLRAFEAFWQAWPEQRREGRDGALRVFISRFSAFATAERKNEALGRLSEQFQRTLQRLEEDRLRRGDVALNYLPSPKNWLRDAEL